MLWLTCIVKLKQLWDGAHWGTSLWLEGHFLCQAGRVILVASADTGRWLIWSWNDEGGTIWQLLFFWVKYEAGSPSRRQEDNSGGLGKMYEMVILERREWPMCSGYMEMWTPELKEAETHQPAWMAFSTNIQRLGRRQEKADGQPRMALLGHVGGRPRKWWGN